MSNIAENLKEIHGKISEACKKCGRDVSEVTLIDVSKTKPMEMVMEAYAAGERNFGENYVQELVAKEEEGPKDIVWHMIGPLQKNKVKKAVKAASIIHSAHSVEIAECINKEAEKLDKVQDILIEINVGDEESKHGIALCEAEQVTLELSKLKNINIRGYMCIPPISYEEGSNRKYFKALNELKEKMNREHGDVVKMDMLSMGMSADFEDAILEGATHVRVGTAIFGARDYSKKN